MHMRFPVTSYSVREAEPYQRRLAHKRQDGLPLYTRKDQREMECSFTQYTILAKGVTKAE